MHKIEIQWLNEVEEKDYPAALSYLSLLYPPEKAALFVSSLKLTNISEFKAKDVFRASALSLLGISNLHVEKDREKIRTGKLMSPLLLVRDPNNGKVIIADGYHRMCAIYEFNEDAWIKCKIV
jgi:disulfide oxidoreductase YuzD